MIEPGTTFAFIHRELAELARQRTLVLLTILGPFFLLLGFGAGYRNDPVVLRTMFVGAGTGSYSELLERGDDRLHDFIDVAGFTTDLDAARAQLRADEVDAVIVFPSQPLGDVLGGQQAEIVVLHDTLNPVQALFIGFGARIATDRLNQAMVERTLAVAQDDLASASTMLTTVEELRRDLREPGPVQQDAAADLASELRVLRDQVDALRAFGDANGATEGMSDLTRTRRTLDEALTQLESGQEPGVLSEPEVARLDAELVEVERALALFGRMEPSVMARPFVTRVDALSEENIDATEYFGASATVLLLQHLALSLGALTFVRDRSLGLLELIRVAPASAADALVGKLVAFVLVGVVVAVPLLLAAQRLLEVPMLGSWWWLLAIVSLVLLASVTMGFVLSLLSHSDTEAVQYSMMVLLGSLFFSGFFIDQGRFTAVASQLARVLPLTSAVSAARDVMLRGQPPATFDLAVLALLAAGCLAASWWLLRRELRTA